MKSALIFGSSGLIGSQLVKLMANNDKYRSIKLFVRSEVPNSNSKIEIIKTDFNNLGNHKDLIIGDDCFFCIGTTRKNTPDKNEYIKIEYGLPVEVAKIAKENSVDSFTYVSSLGANSNASGLYLKNKGKTEEALKKLNFPKLSIIRPSILLGNRKENRIGEKIGIFVMKSLSPLFLGKIKKYKPIKVENVAKAMINVAENDFQQTIFESDQLMEISNL
tara:strand:- start:557 stop:1213 length:657 start_codon:yes stop_codon:yes gene_type:complete